MSVCPLCGEELGRYGCTTDECTPYVAVDPPPAWTAREPRWKFVLESLAGGLDDDGMLKWLSRFKSLDEAYAEAEKLRDGMIAT